MLFPPGSAAETSYVRDILSAAYENTALRLPSHFLTIFEYTLRSFCLSAFSRVPRFPPSSAGKKLSLDPNLALACKNL